MVRRLCAALAIGCWRKCQGVRLSEAEMKTLCIHVRLHYGGLWLGYSKVGLGGTTLC